MTDSDMRRWRACIEGALNGVALSLAPLALFTKTRPSLCVHDLPHQTGSSWRNLEAWCMEMDIALFDKVALVEKAMVV